ncbi:OmpA family protein [Serratia sp. M24T3]|uniref:OmpA family protein n=1 Tax=Serratia sp. M24T3 TaxID=932213 RepID=UPI00025B902F|nr:OmpA family protein [Serratia sp. M24T3]EIC86599.1 hypothetical protein SPM24T3_00915 [Serratia sp. M24T3]
MSGPIRLIMLLVGTSLALWLILGIWILPASNQIVLSLLTATISITTGYFQWRRYCLHKVAHQHFENSVLPPEDFQGAVILVCADYKTLFSTLKLFRESRLSFYLPVKTPEQLPIIAQILSTERPALIAQISILMAIVPEQHQEIDEVAQSLRSWQRAIAQCKCWLNGVPPVWFSLWISSLGNPSEQADRWYTITPFQKGIQVHEAGSVSIPLEEWSHHQAACNLQERFSITLWLESLQSWYQANIQSILSQPQGDALPIIPCACGVCFMPVQCAAGNLWQRHIATMTSLPILASSIPSSLTLPEVLLPYLPRRRAISRLMQTWQLFGLLGGIFLLFALLGSFFNNQRLIQSVGVHLSLYNGLTGTLPAAKTQARQQLRADAQLLDGWLLDGSPMNMSLGLYQGMRLIAPLTAAINSGSPPLPISTPPPVIKTNDKQPKTLSIDSLSLFDVGKSALKPDSNKVLIKALINIQSQPGKLIVIAGHTDSTGDARKNQVLSQKRAEALRSWMLATSEISPSCFVIKGYGARRPLASNDTTEGRAANRRVEITLQTQANGCPTRKHQLASDSDTGITTSKEK